MVPRKQGPTRRVEVKVEINFPYEFTTGKAIGIQLGRLVVGDSVCRLMFSPDGKLHMLCPLEAKEFIQFWPEQVGEVLFGFGDQNEQG